MKIVHTYPFPAPIDNNVPELPLGLVTGGGETYPYRLSLMQAKLGHAVTFLTSKFDGIKSDKVIRDHWTIRYLKTIKRNSVQYAVIIPLFLTLFFTNYDIYISHQLPTITSLITGLIAKIKRKPFLVQYLGFRPDVNPNAKLLTKINSMLVTTMIFPNEYAANFFKNYLPENKIKIVPYGVDIEYYSNLKNDKRPKSMADPACKYVLYVGRLLSSKGIDLLIKSFVRVSQNNPNIRLVIVGKGPFKQNLEELIKLNNLSNVVSMEGFIPDEELGFYYHNADVFVLPSVYTDCFGNYHPEPEAFGLVLAEAMCNDTPVIASNVGGVPAWITNEYNGLLFESGSETDLADCITRIIVDKELSNLLVRNAREALNKNHSLNKIANDFINVNK